MVKNTNVILSKIYPMFAKSLEKNTPALKKCIGNYITSRHVELYDTAPYHRIYFGKHELDEFHKAIGISEQQIIDELQYAFFWNVAYNPPQVKEAFTVAMLSCIRYYLLKGDMKSAELCTIYLAFSGKFYASVHALSFPKFPPSEHRAVMEYVINNKLSEKFDLRKEGSLFGAIRSLCITWLNTYASVLKSKDFDDQDAGMVIQQLRDREKSFMKNIASLYYDAYDNKDFLNYESDNLSDGDSYRLADSDSLRAEKITEMALNHMLTTTVDMKICTMCADQNVKALEIKDIIESILSDNHNIQKLKSDVINVLISDFVKNNRGKDISSLDFVAYSIRTKPNTKDKNILKMKQTILDWLDENSPQFRKRKNRQATAISYYKAILQYIVLIINKVSS